MYLRKQVPLRLPEELHTKIADRAEKRGVSVNHWIVLALTHAVERTGDHITEVQTKEYRL